MIKPTLREPDGRRILPAFASDGCFSLLPGETRRLSIETRTALASMQVTFEGWNTAPLTLSVTGATREPAR